MRWFFVYNFKIKTFIFIVPSFALHHIEIVISNFIAFVVKFCFIFFFFDKIHIMKVQNETDHFVAHQLMYDNRLKIWLNDRFIPNRMISMFKTAFISSDGKHDIIIIAILMFIINESKWAAVALLITILEMNDNENMGERKKKYGIVHLLLA